MKTKLEHLIDFANLQMKMEEIENQLDDLPKQYAKLLIKYRKDRQKLYILLGSDAEKIDKHIALIKRMLQHNIKIN